MPKTTTPDLIGSLEAAQLLQIDRSTLTRWVKRDKIKPVLTGTGETGEMFFDRAVVQSLAPQTPAGSPLTREPAGAFVAPERKAG